MFSARMKTFFHNILLLYFIIDKMKYEQNGGLGEGGGERILSLLENSDQLHGREQKSTDRNIQNNRKRTKNNDRTHNGWVNERCYRMR